MSFFLGRSSTFSTEPIMKPSVNGSDFMLRNFTHEFFSDRRLTAYYADDGNIHYGLWNPNPILGFKKAPKDNMAWDNYYAAKEKEEFEYEKGKVEIEDMFNGFLDPLTENHPITNFYPLYPHSNFTPQPFVPDMGILPTDIMQIPTGQVSNIVPTDSRVKIAYDIDPTMNSNNNSMNFTNYAIPPAYNNNVPANYYYATQFPQYASENNFTYTYQQIPPSQNSQYNIPNTYYNMMNINSMPLYPNMNNNSGGSSVPNLPSITPQPPILYPNTTPNIATWTNSQTPNDWDDFFSYYNYNWNDTNPNWQETWMQNPAQWENNYYPKHYVNNLEYYNQPMAYYVYQGNYGNGNVSNQLAQQPQTSYGIYNNGDDGMFRNPYLTSPYNNPNQWSYGFGHNHLHTHNDGTTHMHPHDAIHHAGTYGPYGVAHFLQKPKPPIVKIPIPAPSGQALFDGITERTGNMLHPGKIPDNNEPLGDYVFPYPKLI